MKIKLAKLNASEEDGVAFAYDMENFPDGDSLLSYLQKKADITVLSKSSWKFTDDYFSEFEFKGYKFEIATPFTSPWLVALKGCPEEIFNELLGYVKSYSGSPRIRGLREIIRSLKLPSYKGIYSIKKKENQ